MTPDRLSPSRRALLATPLLALPARAQPFGLRGTPQQGGFLIGRTLPGGRAALDGQALRVSPEGLFAFGFGRDHGPRATLTVNGQPQTLEVARRQWDVQHITGLPPAQVTPDAATLERIRVERERLAAVRAVDSARTGFAEGLAWPARGRISGVFGSQRVLNGQSRQPHYGLDVAGPVGTPILAAASGQVTLAAEFHFFGRLVVLDHGHGVNTLYAHLNAIHVREGQAVTRGERIADMGATGRVTGPHLHFSLSWYRVWLDPQPVLEG
ncbi:MAG: M23 family metallopeptidase [Acetobacteraceae bacterium]|nr:M23 family metallopeptidase [Acetobacteraceae bacterium]